MTRKLSPEAEKEENKLLREHHKRMQIQHGIIDKNGNRIKREKKWGKVGKNGTK